MLSVFFLLFSFADNSSFFNRTTVSSAEGPFYSSAEMVSEASRKAGFENTGVGFGGCERDGG